MQQIRESMKNKKASQFVSLLICNNTLAGEVGLEPTIPGARNQCLTIWPLAIILVLACYVACSAFAFLLTPIYIVVRPSKEYVIASGNYAIWPLAIIPRHSGALARDHR